MKSLPGRRQFLKGMAALGAGVYIMPVLGASLQHKAITLLLSPGVNHSRFSYGIGQTLPIQVQSLVPFQPRDWRKIIQRHRGERLIGLMDNASFTIFETILADHGARFLATGHHAHGHRFVTVPETAGIAASLDHCLSGSTAGYRLEEVCRGKPRPALGNSGAINYSRGQDWASATGAFYAQIANGTWTAGTSGKFNRNTTSMPSTKDALVSFVVEA